MQEKEISAGTLDLMPGYHAERYGTDISLMDLEGCRVARLPGYTEPTEEPVAPNQEWQDLCGTLLMLTHSHASECEILRERLNEARKAARRGREGAGHLRPHSGRSVPVLLPNGAGETVREAVERRPFDEPGAYEGVVVVRREAESTRRL